MERARLRRLAPLLLAALALLATAAAPARAQTDSTVYLPLVIRPAVATLAFATAVNPETGEPINPSPTLPAGTDLIYVVYTLEGLQGRQYRIDFTYADGETLTGSTRTAASNAFRNWTSYCITTGFSCASGRVPLEAGPYTARLYIDGQLFTEGQAAIP